jgi:hypothetical protein
LTAHDKSFATCRDRPKPIPVDDIIVYMPDGLCCAHCGEPHRPHDVELTGDGFRLICRGGCHQVSLECRPA